MIATAKKPTNRLPKTSRNGNSDDAHAVPLSISLPKPDVRIMQLHLKGVTPLIVHAQGVKTRKAIEDKQQQKAKGPRAKRDPHEEYLSCFYMMPGSAPPDTKKARYGVPASGFKRACEGVCTGGFVTGLSGTFVRRAFFVLDDGAGLVEIKCSKPKMRTDSVRIGKFPNKTLDYRYRPEFEQWSCTLRIRYNATAISAEQIANIFMYAGLHEGWGEMRAGKGYSNGQWEVVNK